MSTTAHYLSDLQQWVDHPEPIWQNRHVRLMPGGVVHLYCSNGKSAGFAAFLSLEEAAHALVHADSIRWFDDSR